MGAKPRQKPASLGEKLLLIRTTLGLSQSAMLKQLGFEGAIWYNQSSAYERGRNEPPLPILSQYARIANVIADVLIDDELDLPARLPSPTKSEGIRRKSPARRKRR